MKKVFIASLLAVSTCLVSCNKTDSVAAPIVPAPTTGPRSFQERVEEIDIVWGEAPHFSVQIADHDKNRSDQVILLLKNRVGDTTLSFHDEASGSTAEVECVGKHCDGYKAKLHLVLNGESFDSEIESEELKILGGQWSGKGAPMDGQDFEKTAFERIDAAFERFPGVVDVFITSADGKPLFFNATMRFHGEIFTIAAPFGTDKVGHFVTLEGLEFKPSRIRLDAVFVPQAEGQGPGFGVVFRDWKSGEPLGVSRELLGIVAGPSSQE